MNSEIEVKSVKPKKIANFHELELKKPTHALVRNTDLVLIKYTDEDVSVLYGRCLHRGALLADGDVKGDNLVCGVHQWDFRYQTGISEYNPNERLQKFHAWVKEDGVYIDEQEIIEFERRFPQTMYKRDEYLGAYIAINEDSAEPENKYIRNLAMKGLPGSHGEMVAMGVSRTLLPSWNNIQILTAQLANTPLLDKDPVETKVIIGPNAKKPLKLEIPIFVSDMSFGSLSEEAKIALAKGAEKAGTGICSGEGGMLPEEQASNSKYFYELASAKFGFTWDKLLKVQAFHFKGGQAAKTGTGGHLPGSKVVGKIAEVRGLEEGKDAISPSRFVDFNSLSEFQDFAQQVREKTGGIPIGFKLSANHIEEDIDAALEIGVDYIILDGRGGGTGAAPKLFRDHISVPTIPALARARKHLDKLGRNDITLVITGGLRTAPDFIKALALGADAIAVSNSALQAIGCQGMRACNTNNCPVGIATQKPHLRARLDIQKSSEQLTRFLTSTIDLMKVMARACGHDSFSKFNINDLSTFDREISSLSGVKYGGIK
ncbi:MAG: glutamate synthase-related protein [Candidatus Hodarchaeales archaeon]